MILDQFFEQITFQLSANLPFVAYRKPNTTTIKAMLQHNDALYSLVDFSESGFVFAPFDSREVTYIMPLEHSKIIDVEFVADDLLEHDIHKKSVSANVVNVNSEVDKQSHIKRVVDCIETIKSGICSKIVLSRREQLEYLENDPITIFKRLLHRYPTAFVYIWYHPKVGLWLGATPETLLSITGNQLKTMALAGTQSFEGSTEVVWEEKEREEQQIVTDFIVEGLKSAVDNSEGLHNTIKVFGPKTVQAGNLLHLLTEISMPLKPEPQLLKSILDAIHPTPAVCGFPKERAKTYIIDNEGYPREFYSGFMGELNVKETISRNTNRRNVENNAYGSQKTVTHLYVNLRCMQIKDQELYIYVGGGITKDSNAEAEWSETVHKSIIIKSVL
ncbi:chorismate-binding protein [Gelidibacter sp.]|uniref:chorismate-binding protein n=1 Tax=Gelidibacter sp. TaxID=2018083 RepID=UPI002D806CC5|nr:chorismate-binding protein [Gelidibacter sp.]